MLEIHLKSNPVNAPTLLFIGWTHRADEDLALFRWSTPMLTEQSKLTPHCQNRSNWLLSQRWRTTSINREASDGGSVSSAVAYRVKLQRKSHEHLLSWWSQICECVSVNHSYTVQTAGRLIKQTSISAVCLLLLYAVDYLSSVLKFFLNHWLCKNLETEPLDLKNGSQ